MLRCQVVAAHIPGTPGFGAGVLLSVCFRGVPRRTRVVPEERSLTWNEELAWPLDACPLSVTDTLSLRLRRWDCPLPQGDLGATTVSLDELVANPSLLLARRDIPLLDHRERPTGCTATLRCSCDPPGAAGDVAAVTALGQVAPEPPAVAPADRREDFQVRVRVIQGRQLRGSALRPVVRVGIGPRSFRTRSRSGNNPYFDQVFCQNFRLTPEQLVALPIQIQVLRSPNICTKAVIGVFELDIGTVYSAPGRSLSRRWLSLQHPRFRDGRSQGLLQVTLLVRRAGERAQVQEVPAGDEDVEANLLRPPARGAALQIRVFRAEGLPREEPAWLCLGGTEGSAKVSVRVGFAGRTLCTRGVPPDASPEWNEVLSFPLRLPPICDEILLEVLRGSCRSRVLARATLRLSQICRDPDELEEGTPTFLPSFGPGFLPLYGPRADAARDSGPVYWGRLLLELCTLEGTPAGVAAVAPVDAERAQSRLPRCQLGLCGVFYSATMVPGGPEPLRLELGIGHAAAATAPERPERLGDLYHHLPWLGDKPVAAVTSLWEDAGPRWDSLNALRALCERLERNLAELRGPRGDPTGAIGARLLQELAQDCTEALGCLEAQPALTVLDQQLRSARRRLLRQLRGELRNPPWLRGDALGTAARGWLRRAAALAVEPQAGVPDVQLWLLRGQLRVASARVPATEVLHSARGPGACGRLCGRILTLFLGCGDAPAQVRVRLWLGRVAESGDLARLLEGTLRFYCETYEHQTLLLGHWGPRKLLGRPTFSDSSGRAGHPPEQLQPPKGWRWDGPWSVERPRRALSRPAAGAVLEEPCESQRCDPTDGQDPEELWEDEAWQPECFWGCTFQPKVPAGPRCRRRRWQRSLVPAEPPPVAPLFLLRGVPDPEDPGQDNPAVAPQLPGGSSPTPLQQPLPFVLCSFQRPGCFQLRCYIFQALDLSTGNARTSIDATAHVSFVSRSQRTRAVRGALDPRWEQALLFPRVLLFGDPRRLREDPPAVVVEVWDQPGQGAGVLLGRSVCLPQVWLDVRHREPPRLQPHPLQGPRGPAGELLAAFELLQEPEDGSPAPLSPLPLREDGFGIPPELRPRLQRVALEVLAWGLRGLRGAVREPRLEVQWGEQSLWTPAIPDVATNPNFPSNAFVLTLALPEQERFVPPVRLRLWHRVGSGRPQLLGQARLRDLGRYRCPAPRREQLLGSGAAHTVVSMPDELLSLPVSSSLWRRCCSFFLSLLPVRKAQDLLSCLRSHRAEDEDEEDEEKEEEEERDWWSKFYAAMEDKDPKSRRGTNGDRLKIYDCELEEVPEFEGLQDFCQTFPLHKPGRAPEPVGSFKGLFRIYPEPEEGDATPAPRCFQRLPPSLPQHCLVRVYIVRAFELSPRDVTGLSDPYVRVALGKRTLGQRDQYVPNSLEPVFGRMFELTATIPLEKDLRVTIMDHDKVPPDQEIGSTTIDLEDRLLSRHRARCGLPARYRPSGPACWRDQLCPSRTLELLTDPRGLPGPRFSHQGTALSLGGQSFELRDFERGRPPPPHAGERRERLALHVLNLCELVPEHLETRSLRRGGRPGLEQGKVQMWVDIFPTSLGPPGPPVNIDPRKAEGYELRCVVWRVRDTDLGDVNLLGQRMSDIYVSGWLDGLPEQRQHTDIHYRSRDGNGAFNWRFVFHFEFLAAEKLCAIRHKDHVWSLDETLLKVPPKLILQVWDNDKFKADDLLGVLELELTRLQRPARSARLCRAALGDPSWWPWGWPWWPWGWPWWPSWPWCRPPALERAPLNLFHRRRARGWWPCTMQEDSGQRLSGKLELSLELLTAREAEERPVGRGREEPNRHPTLPAPRRPKSSFLWLRSPLSLVRHGVPWRCLLCAGLALAALLLLLLLHSFIPGSLTVRVADPRQLLRAPGKEPAGTAGGRGAKA